MEGECSQPGDPPSSILQLTIAQSIHPRRVLLPTRFNQPGVIDQKLKALFSLSPARPNQILIAKLII
jgi:hypothetical protein